MSKIESIVILVMHRYNVGMDPFMSRDTIHNLVYILQELIGEELELVFEETDRGYYSPRLEGIISCMTPEYITLYDDHEVGVRDAMRYTEQVVRLAEKTVLEETQRRLDILYRLMSGYEEESGIRLLTLAMSMWLTMSASNDEYIIRQLSKRNYTERSIKTVLNHVREVILKSVLKGGIGNEV